MVVATNTIGVGAQALATTMNCYEQLRTTTNNYELLRIYYELLRTTANNCELLRTTANYYEQQQAKTLGSKAVRSIRIDYTQKAPYLLKV